MNRQKFAAFALAGIALLTAACTAADTTVVLSQPSQSGISVSGRGTVAVTPNIAVLTLGVEVTLATVGDARAEAADAMTAIQASLTANDVAATDIKTQSFSIQPQYDYRRDGPAEIIGYRVANSLVIKVRDIDTISTVLDDAVDAGGDTVRVNDISFTVDQPEQYQGEARQLAVEDARERAETLAALAGVTLGKARSVSESSFGGSSFDGGFGGAILSAASRGPTPISPGEAEISLSVFVVYDID
ncbi:MAG TPA: SIMPL domain-containing protein [Dehalococcoidia bacterium]|nr:SIMPL domain-containing protein [Dehalococcoidia bacterium]